MQLTWVLGTQQRWAQMQQKAGLSGYVCFYAGRRVGVRFPTIVVSFVLGYRGEEERMGKFVTGLLGVVAGFALAHLVNQTPEGKTLIARARATVETFTNGVLDAWRS